MKSKSFKIIGADTLECKFHLMDNQLRHEARSYGLIDSDLCLDDDEMADPKAVKRADRAAVIPLMKMLDSLAQARERISDVGDEEGLDEDFAALMAALEEQRSKIVALAKQALARGELAWELLPHAYCRGDEVVASTDDASHGAEVVSIVRRESLFGACMLLSYRFHAFDGRSFRWARRSRQIPQYEGLKGAEQLGLAHMAPLAAKELEARGAVYAAYCLDPSYLRYEGSLTRRGWRGDKRLRATGRTMADMRSMQEMDPDYDGYYGEFDEDDDGGPPAREQHLDAKRLRLSSPYVYGFSFLCKAWGEMAVAKLRPIEFRKDAFDKLVLDAGRKRLIQALVSQGNGGFADLIDGKGGGCVFLLHGQPGVGKTLTAEAIAERLERPLYMVGAGELGTTPDQLEERLKSVLDTAHAWNAVLLIDEVDIFLERRAGGDVARNAMVGIFLRLLEYHQGILFMTTNRVDDIDVAFLSRVSLGLRYDALGDDQRSAVWSNLLASTGAFDMAAIDARGLGRLDINGRQIKHCIRLALAVAASEGRPPAQSDLADMASLALEFKRDFGSAHEAGRP